MAESLKDGLGPAPPSSKRLNTTPTAWNHWLISRLIWMVLAMVALAVMFLLFMKVAYR